jgi:hypothetical protein
LWEGRVSPLDDTFEHVTGRLSGAFEPKAVDRVFAAERSDV